MGVSDDTSVRFHISFPPDAQPAAQASIRSVIPPLVTRASLQAYEQNLLIDEDVLTESHERCRHAGVDVYETQPRHRLCADEFRSMSLPYSGLKSYARLLFSDVYKNISTPNTVFVLTNATGCIIHLHSSPEINHWVNAHCGLGPGVDLGEESCGSNAVSMALHRHSPAAMQAEQHYCALFKECCSVAHPVEGWDGNIHACVAIFSHIEDGIGDKVALVHCLARELSQYSLHNLSHSNGKSVRSSQKNTGVKTDIVLTPRQQRVLSLFAEGLSYKQIARTLDLASTKTVEEHLDAIRNKLRVSHRRQCIQRAVELGLLGHDSFSPK